MIDDFVNNKEKSEELRAKTEWGLRKKWNDDSICMRELIRYKYSETDERHEGENERSIKGNEEEYKKVDNDNYYVIIDDDIDLDWCVSDDIHNNVCFERILSKLIIIKSIPCRKLSYSNRMEFMRILGSALVSAIENKEKEANRLLYHARDFIYERLAEKSRLYTLSISTLLLFIIFLLWGESEHITDLEKYQGGLWGIIGAYVSIIRKSGMEKHDAEAGLIIHLLNVLVRFVCAFIIGILGVMLMCQGAILPVSLNNIGKGVFGNCIIGFVCGLSERFIPNLMASLPQGK